MSYKQYFNEVEEVCRILDEWVKGVEPAALEYPEDEELFTATWQAVELLSRAYQTLLPLIALDMGKGNLLLPDVEKGDE